MKKFITGKWRFVSYPLLALLGLFFLPITIGVLLIWFANKKVGNKKIRYSLIGVLGLITLFFGGAYVAALVSPSPDKEPEVEITQKVSGLTAPSPTPTWTPTTAPNNPDILLVKVARVIDGDTIEIEGGQRVRYIGIDTPELGQNADCYAREAYEKNKELVGNEIVGLEKDVSETDRYGRLLRYVYMGDLLINDVLVREGYANASSYPPDVKYQERFRGAEREARENSRGLWASCGVQGAATSQPTITFAPTKPATISNTPAPTQAPAPQQQSGSGSYVCNCKKTCTQISSCAEAQYQLNVCGCTERDRDNDGIACDGAPLSCQY